MRLSLTLLAFVSLLGCASAVKTPVKVASIPVKVATNTVKETVTLPVKVVKDTVAKPKQAPKEQKKSNDKADKK